LTARLAPALLASRTEVAALRLADGPRPFAALTATPLTATAYDCRVSTRLEVSAAGAVGVEPAGAERAGGEPEGSSRTRVPEIVRRRLAQIDRRLDPLSWVAAGVVTAIAAIIRLVGLDRPGHIVFDETYYAPNAYALLKYGVEWNVPDGGANPVNGAPSFGEGPAYVVHPPLGKWMIAAGEWIFGYTPFGWRISAAVVGVASVLMIIRITQRLFGSIVLGAAAGLLMALDGMHVVMSRTALLDIFLLFFLVAAFGALLLDRDARRRRWLHAVENGLDRPPFSWRHAPWWRFAAAALLGCALAVKWSAAFYIPVFLVLVIVWEVGARRSAGVARPWRGMWVREAGSLLAAAVIVPAVYLASWTGWFATDRGYLRTWLADNGQAEPDVIGPLRNLIHYHSEALRFHIPLSSEHPWESSPWQWLLLGRPVAIHWATDGTCGAASCASQVLLLGTPLLWWAFLPAVAIMTWIGIARRDWRVPPILLAAAAGIVPWFFFPDRVMFYFYALPAEPFLVLAVVYVLGAMISPARAGPATVLGFDRRAVAVILAGGYVMLVALNFAYFYPIFSGQVIPYEAWHARMWLSTWI
jgi:dolichyl-phosphate-mannose--protein O-mannosyl transferase